MSKSSQKEIILKYLNEVNDWVFSYELQGKNTKYGWLGSQADRRVRELTGGVGENPSFEYKGEYNGIKYLIKGRIIDRCRQYRVRILEDDKPICVSCLKTGFLIKDKDNYFYCKDCYVRHYGN